MKKTIGILGGMGPLATADLFRKIVSLTKATKDQDHIPVLIDSNTAIPDRTEAILHGGESPLPQMIKSAKRLEAMGADFLVMPCNTAHYFYSQVAASIHIPMLHMIQEAAREIASLGFQGSALLATTGTVESGIYQQVFLHENRGSSQEKNSFQIRPPGTLDASLPSNKDPRHSFPQSREDSLSLLSNREDLQAAWQSPSSQVGDQKNLPPKKIALPTPSPSKLFLPSREGQQALMDMVYDGVKAGRNTWDTAAVRKELDSLVEQGAEDFILGCTELPLAFQMYHLDFPFLDVTSILARQAVLFAGGEINQTHSFSPLPNTELAGF